ncbi:MAG: phage portal protein [Clostridia bacterium]|nr:phage portal protein [Clostridia bacterium]
MGIVSSLFKTKNSALSNPEKWLIDLLGGAKSKSGVQVNIDRALQVMAVYACVKLLSETIASLPLPLYRRLERGKEKAYAHPLYPVLHDIANPEMTSFEFRQTLMVNMLLTKGGFAEIVRNGAGQIAELWPIPSGSVDVKRDPKTKELLYFIHAPDGKGYILKASQVLHLKGMNLDGVNSFEPVVLAREAFGLAIATEEFGARFFSQGTNAGGIAEYPGQLSDEAFERYKKTFNEAHSGLTNSNRIIFLEQGLKFHKIDTPPDSSQFIESRKFQVIEVARFFNVPPHMIMDLERATFSNIEQQAIGFVVYTMRPWFVKIEQAISKDLLNPTERKKYFAKFTVDGLLRGDFRTRMEGYSFGRQNGWLSANDIRELEDMNPIPNGDIYLQPLNYIEAGKEPTEQTRNQ